MQAQVQVPQVQVNQEGEDFINKSFRDFYDYDVKVPFSVNVTQRMKLLVAEYPDIPDDYKTRRHVHFWLKVIKELGQEEDYPYPNWLGDVEDFIPSLN